VEFEMGKTYEELKIGEKASFSKTITETDIVLFAAISGDFNPIHMNEEFAKHTPFKKRIAHGAIPQSLIAPVLGMRLPGLGTVAVEITCRFKAPTYIGDTITATAEVAEKIPEKKWVKMKLTWTNQEGKTIAQGQAIVMPPARANKTTKGKESKMALSDVKEVFEKMKEIFNSTAAQGLDAVFQFVITGEGGGKWSVAVRDGKCHIQEGTHDSPNVTLTMSGQTWLAMVNGQLNGMQAFMSGQLKAEGDIMLAQRIPELFPF